MAIKALFRRLPVKLLRDHSFDPIHDVGEWDADEPLAAGRLDLVLAPAADEFNGVAFEGLSYHYEYQSDEAPLFYLLDRASWSSGAGGSASRCSPGPTTARPSPAR